MGCKQSSINNQIKRNQLNKSANTCQLSREFSQVNSSRSLETDTSLLESRVNSLEKTLQECVERIKFLQQEVEQSKLPPSLLNYPPITTIRLNSPSIPVAATPTIPPPPPPLPSSTSPIDTALPMQQQREVLKKISPLKKLSQKCQSLGPSISVEDLRSVRLKKTPLNPKTVQIKVF